jgi:hypothetical protein
LRVAFHDIVKAFRPSSGLASLHDGLRRHNDTGKVNCMGIIRGANVVQLKSVVAPASKCHVTVGCDDEPARVQKNTLKVVARLFFRNAMHRSVNKTGVD